MIIMDSRLRGNDKPTMIDSSKSLNLSFFFVIVGLDPTTQKGIGQSHPPNITVKVIHVHRLVWYKQTESIESAINREKQIKKWRRRWKLELIEKMNPDWKDLYDEIIK